MSFVYILITQVRSLREICSARLEFSVWLSCLTSLCSANSPFQSLHEFSFKVCYLFCHSCESFVVFYLFCVKSRTFTTSFCLFHCNACGHEKKLTLLKKPVGKTRVKGTFWWLEISCLFAIEGRCVAVPPFWGSSLTLAFTACGWLDPWEQHKGEHLLEALPIWLGAAYLGVFPNSQIKYLD